MCDGELGLISRNVAPEGFSLNSGLTYLPEVDGYIRVARAVGDVPPGRMRRDVGYTLDAVAQVLQDVGPPPSIVDLTALNVFSSYLVLDALVGNSDRHPGNWALLESGDGHRFLAPTYDHGSALGAGMTERNRRSRDPLAFARSGRANPFTPPKQSLVSLAIDAVVRAGATMWLERAASLDDDCVAAALAAPDGRMSEVASRFMARVILENRRRLSDGDAAQG